MNPPSEDDVIPVEHFDSRFIGIAYQDPFDRFLCAERHARRHSLIAKKLLMDPLGLQNQAIVDDGGGS
jgi:hypothetical protein